FGGIRVYRDSQRVYNYGESGNDWLGLDEKRLNAPGRYLSNNVVIGNVEIDRQSTLGLFEKTNREGFIENENSKIFVKIIKQAVFEFGFKVQEYKFLIKKMYSETRKNRADEIYENLIATIDSADISEKSRTEIKEGVFLYKNQVDFIKQILFNLSINTLDYL